MWYFVLGTLCAIAIVLDARKRKAVRLAGWAPAAIILPFAFVPIYKAIRPLEAAEVREGGTAWNILRDFALMWTLIAAVSAGIAVAGISPAAFSSGSSAEQAAYVFGVTIGLGAYGALWLFPVVGALVIGLFVKQPLLVEKGPTGPLASLAVLEVNSEVPEMWT